MKGEVRVLKEQQITLSKQQFDLLIKLIRFLSENAEKLKKEILYFYGGGHHGIMTLLGAMSGVLPLASGVAFGWALRNRFEDVAEYFKGHDLEVKLNNREVEISEIDNKESKLVLDERVFTFLLGFFTGMADGKLVLSEDRVMLTIVLDRDLYGVGLDVAVFMFYKDVIPPCELN